MHRVEGTIQRYDWGDEAAIPRLLGRTPDGSPQAELWFGTHVGAPSVLDGGSPLSDLTGPLPYLLKVLAAARPLSIQVHPSAAQAEAGFARENRLGIPLDAPQRTYRDPHHKPELIYALTPFEAMCGIAPLDATDALLEQLGPAAASLRAVLTHGGVDAVIALLLHERPPLDDLLTAAAHSDARRARWLVRLGELHPSDPSAALALFLNDIVLEPGQALFLGAGTMHAYLGGVGVEVMANSDNVVRCGLTTKHVDADEVLRVVDTTPVADPLVASTAHDNVVSFPVPVDDFRIDIVHVDSHAGWTAVGPELALCIKGSTEQLRRGQCGALVSGEDVSFDGEATICRIGTNITK
ncbi:MAG TPA: mannose-6-phosphate isomerase, class I [Ilumatobacteraceae bacterium]